MRCKHYIKNLLVFLPLIFSGKLYEMTYFIPTLLGFLSFCFVSSAVYIINDIQDRQADKQNEKKKNRPIASGKISVKKAFLLMLFLMITSFSITIYIMKTNVLGYLFIVSYFILNILYSIKLKHIPILDVTILAIGFLIRVLYGAEIIDVQVSNWLYLTILSFSFYMSLGKRRNEFIKNGSKSRKVLESYNENFLDKNMYLFLGLAIIFYALWCIDIAIPNIIWTVPLVMIICMQYSAILEGDSYGDPVEVLLNNKSLMATTILFGLIMFLLMYVI